jgi:hypothetical protein
MGPPVVSRVGWTTVNSTVGTIETIENCISQWICPVKTHANDPKIIVGERVKYANVSKKYILSFEINELSANFGAEIVVCSKPGANRCWIAPNPGLKRRNAIRHSFFWGKDQLNHIRPCLADRDTHILEELHCDPLPQLVRWLRSMEFLTIRSLCDWPNYWVWHSGIFVVCLIVCMVRRK